MKIISDALFLEDGQFHKGTLTIQGGRIEKIESITDNYEKSSYEPKDSVLDATGCFVIPGLIDTHFHGCFGGDFSDGTISVLKNIAKYQLQNGTTSICPATMTLPLSHILGCLESAKAFLSFEKEMVSLPKTSFPYASLLGVYLEGPFFSKEKKGAQNEAYLRLPEIAWLKKLPSNLLSLIKVISLAPELPGGINFIKESRQFPGTPQISLGHTTATSDVIDAAFTAGAQRVTHLFNAMAHPEAMLSAISRKDNAFAELICDGYHNSKERILSAYEFLGDDKIILISDSMRATGLGDGRYLLGGQTVEVKGKLATLPSGNKAGSVSTLFDCLRTAVSLGVPLASAIKSATCNPAKSLNVAEQVGYIKENAIADILILSPDLTIQHVIKQGMLIK